VQNYVDSATAANDFAKLDPTTFADLKLGAVDRASTGFPHYLTARISNSGMPAATCATALCFESGTAAVTVPFMLSRSASAHVVYGAADIGIALADSDGARVEGLGATAGLCNNPSAADCYDLDADASAGNDRALLGTTEFRHGRSHLDNAVGSELLALAMPIKLEYWDGTRYVTSTVDDLSTLTLALGNYLGNLASGETTLTAPVFANGVGQVGLSSPGAGNNGSVDATVTAPSYLPGDTARGTFGVYKGNKAFIYLRESY
jgi:MSHA biogenesis protein MshQ